MALNNGYTGMRAMHDTWPTEGVGGVQGTGSALGFFNGGYCSSGSMGCQPMGCFECLPVPPPLSAFVGPQLTVDTLDMSKIRAREGVEEATPKSEAGVDFEPQFSAELTTAQRQC